MQTNLDVSVSPKDPTLTSTQSTKLITLNNVL